MVGGTGIRQLLAVKLVVTPTTVPTPAPAAERTPSGASSHASAAAASTASRSQASGVAGGVGLAELDVVARDAWCRRRRSRRAARAPWRPTAWSPR